MKIHNFYIGLCYRIFLLIRADIRSSQNSYLLVVLIEILRKLKNGERLDRDDIVKEINQITKRILLDDIESSGVDYSNPPSLIHLKVLNEILEEALFLLNQKEFQRAYDLIDAVHFLPEIMITEDWIEKEYWDNFIIPYRNKWNDHFLKDLEPQIRISR
ncbi:hypothetical protein [Cohnella sp. 56]|uniref:hypothetical protein n=1 Tax=Cohnella sp. 56 TaxID=3113722 RepID=UPI0030E7D42A